VALRHWLSPSLPFRPIIMEYRKKVSILDYAYHYYLGSLQQDVDCARPAVDLARGDECQYAIPLSEPAVDSVLEDWTAIP